MDTTKDTTMQHVTDAVIAEIKRAAEHPLQAPVIVRAAVMLGILARIEQLESDLATAEQDSRQKQARIERLEEEECKQAALLDCLNEWKALAKSAEKERDALRAKIAEMEKQEPAGYGVRYVEPTNGEEDWDSIWKYRVFAEDHIKDFTQAYADVGEPVGASTVVPLYARAGAQPAPSVPEGFSREDLEAVAAGLDGYEKTVNVGNVTGEGDDHLESTTAYAARFIRTMLAAAPEAKP